VRGRDRLEARSLGRGARTLVGIALTLLLLATQAQFVAGAKATDKEKEAGSLAAAESTETPGPDATADEASAEDPPAFDPSPAPEPTEDPPGDEGTDSSGGGETDGGATVGEDETSTGPDGGADQEDPATDEGSDAVADGEGEASPRTGSDSRQEATRAQQPPPDISCSGAFSGRPPGSLAKTATRDGQSLPDGSLIEAGDVIVFTITWNTADWVGEELDKVLDCVQVNGQDAPQLSVEEKPTENDGVFTHQITVPGNLETGDVLCDRARLSGNPTGDNPSTQKSNVLCFTVTEELPPDVHVTKSASDLEVGPGDHVTYTITVSNDGEGTATDVVVTDDLHDDLAILAIDPADACDVGDGNTLTCSLGNIGPGDESTITIEVAVPSDFCGTLTNQAHVSASNEPEEDQDDNDSEEVVIEVLCQPDVMVEKTAVIEGNPRPGDEFDFSITVTNVGTGTAEDVVLTDVIQPGLVIVDVPENCTIEPGEDGETVTCDLGDIEAGDFVTVTIRVKVAEDFCGPIENTAEVTSPSDSNSENDSDTITFEAECQPDVAVSKSAEVDGDEVDEVPSGSTFTYVITVTNDGTGTVEGVTLTDDLDDNLTLVSAHTSQGQCQLSSGNELSCDLGDIPQGESVTVTLEVQVPADFCGELTNTAIVDAENDTNRDNDESDTMIVTVPCGPDIDVRKTNDADTDGSFHDKEEALHEGDAVTFKVVITNTGNVAITLDSLTDEYPLGVGAPFDQECLTAEGENVLGMTLQPGESVTCFFTLDDYAPEPNGEIVDVVTVEGDDIDNPETPPVSADDDSTVTTPEVLPTPPVRPRPPQPPAPPGEVLAATGAELALMGLVALALVLAGIVLSYLGRKEDEPEM
jgi:uncharacterized repeat protein (TIGR01451 family)